MEGERDGEILVDGEADGEIEGEILGDTDKLIDGEIDGLGLVLGLIDGDILGLRDVEIEGDVEPAADMTVATKILAAATSPAFPLAIVSKFSFPGIVIALEICALSMFVRVEFVTVPPPSDCSKVTSDVEPLPASA